MTPFAWDQFDNGARIASLGAGVVIPANRLRPRKLAMQLQKLCSSESVRSRCALLASHFVPPHDPIALCAEVERWVLATVNDEPHVNPPDLGPAAPGLNPRDPIIAG
jgi:rhamnosyltransferase subunit B